MRSRFLLLSCLCLLPGSARAFVRGRTNSGAPLRRTDSDHIQYLVSDKTAAGLTNSSGSVVITSDSDPVAALQAAMDNWTGVASATMGFAPLTLSSLQSASSSQPDGQHLITFADTPENRSATGTGTIAITRIFFNSSSGEIIDTDTIFNPQFTYSTTLQAGTYDIEAVATHELGHALGANHSGLLCASMFFSTRRGVADARLLTSDDIAFVTDTYPAPGASSLGAIAGTVNLSGVGPVRGALVTAVNPATGVAIGTVSSINGAYTIARMPPGQYVLYAEPMDGPVDPNQLAEAGTGANINFSTVVLGGAFTPTSLAVNAGSTTPADLTAEGGLPAMNITQGGSGPVNGAISFGSGGFPLTRGTASDVLLIGRGLDDATLSESSLSFLGAPITIRSGSLTRGSNPSNGLPYLRFTVQVAGDAALGLATAVVRGSTSTVLYSAGVRIVPQTPAFTAAGVVDAASFQAGGVAPGEIISIFGSNLGPPDGVGATRDRGTGLLSASVTNVSVTFNGVRSPLYFVRQDQINAQVPFEVAGQSTVQVAVRYNLVANQGVTVPVLAAHPGVFTFGGTSRAVALNQDGSLNSPDNPLPRGQVATLFATGQGAVNPVLGTGQFALSDPLSGAAQQTTVTFGGVRGDVSFAGLAPGFVGLLQVNARVPDNAPVSANVPVRLTIGGASSPDVVLAVR